MRAEGRRDVDIRPARVEDISALVDIENLCFDADRLSRRSFQRLLTKGHCSLLVAEQDARLLGYVLVLFNRGTSLARIYSFAVLPEARGMGLGERLLLDAEEAARDEGCVAMRLEVRRDNLGAISLYNKLGYRLFTVVPDYYEDHMEALRFEKRIAHPSEPMHMAVPFYAQNTDFTCGPACLIMAMNAIRPGSVEPSVRTELHLWREATTIFMTSGHGGCGPLGLALAAHRRGFAAEVFVSSRGPLFVNTVRDPKKKEIVSLVHEDFAEQAAHTDMQVRVARPSVDLLIERMDQGAVPLVLVSTWTMHREKQPHWMVIAGYDQRFIYAHDPDVDEDTNKTATDCTYIPIRRADFERMARFGRNGVQAAVIISARKGPET